MVTKNILKSN